MRIGASLGLGPFPRRLLAAAAGIGVALCAALPVRAAPGSTPDLTRLYSFDYQPIGEYPLGRLVQGHDGLLYGTTSSGGANGYGLVFSIAPDGTYQTLHSLTGVEGYQLNQPLALGPGGTLYGTAPVGNYCVKSTCSSFGGSVFVVSPQGGFKILYRFPGNGYPTGSGPSGLTLGSDGNFYGSTYSGGVLGPSGVGTVFRITPAGVLTSLHSFTPQEPFNPQPGLTEGADGAFYGATRYAPGNSNGTLYRVTTTGAVTTLHTFTGADGSAPNGALLLAHDGNFYGTTAGGGAYAGGTLFRMTPQGTLTTLYSFNPYEADGPAPGLVEMPDVSLYGVTSSGGIDAGGTLFHFSVSGLMTFEHLFAYADGTYPASGPVLGRDGRLYGTASQAGGSTFPSGSVYAYDPAAQHPPLLGFDKYCINEFGECFPPYDSVIGGKVGLSWYSANLRGCQASGSWSGARPIAGNRQFVTLAVGNFPYTLTCANPTGPVSATVTISVGP